jgi:hypothetical protein
MASTDVTIAHATDDQLSEPDSPASLERIERMAERLPELVDAGDSDTIKRWRDKGNAAALVARKLGYMEESQALARLAVRCAAAIGVISGRALRWRDSAAAPAAPGGIGAQKLSQYRTLGAAMERGLLEAVLDACEGRVEDQRACAIASAMGAGWVPQSRWSALVRKRAAERKLSAVELREQAGCHTDAQLLGQGHAMPWWNCRKIADALEIDVSRLPPVRKGTGRTKPRRAKWITHRFRPGNGRWDEVGVRFTAMRDEMTRAAPDWPNKPAVVEAMHTLSDTIQREMHNPTNQHG